MISNDIFIALGTLRVIQRGPGEITTLPDYGDGATLICEADWIALCEKYGSEEALMEALGIKEDLRDEGDWRYEAAGVSDA